MNTRRKPPKPPNLNVADLHAMLGVIFAFHALSLEEMAKGPYTRVEQEYLDAIVLENKISAILAPYSKNNFDKDDND